MTVIAGTDGCRTGWICVQMNTATRQVTAALYPTAAALDAYAALWTAERCRAGQAIQIPANAPRDAYGLPMRIIV